ENLRTKIVSQELRASYFSSVQDGYKFYIDLLMQLHKQQPSQGYDALALQASERARARSLLEILTEANADIRQGVDPALLERERTLQQQLNARAELQHKLLSGPHTEEQEATLKKEIADLLSQYREVEAQIRQTSPRYAALTQPQPLSLQEIQQQVLDSDTLLLEYSLGEERSYLWAVTPTTISSYELPKRSEIEDAAKSFRTLLTEPSTPPATLAQASAALSQMLLGPVAEQLGQKRLLIVSDGALQYVPFAALPEPSTSQDSNQNQKPLLVQHEIVSLPSASTLAVLRRDFAGRQPAPKKMVVLADPVFDSSDERVKTPSAGNAAGQQSTSSDDSRTLTYAL
ncbi:MAG: CHAT domain-containing protein, partial [Microcystaceae cyanobacterium]